MCIRDRLNVATGDLAVTGAEGGDAQLRLTADEGDDGADYWRLESKASDNKFNLATYASGSWADKITVNTDGDVGIGTGSQQKTLVAKGNIAQSVNASGNPSNDQTLGVFGFLPNAGASNYSCGIQGQAVGTQSGSANPSALLFFTKPSSIGPGSNPTESARIDSDGLKFNGDTAAANALDDYEEGTFNPTFPCYSGTVTSNSSYDTLAYTKIGDMVHITGQVIIGAISSPSGNIDIANLPFAAASYTELADRAYTLNAALLNGSGVPNGQATYPMVIKFDGDGATSARLAVIDPNDDGSIADWVGVGTDFWFNFSYKAA